MTNVQNGIFSDAIAISGSLTAETSSKFLVESRLVGHTHISAEN